jgi:hypothetical protein
VVARAAGDREAAQRSPLAGWDEALRACDLPIAGLDAGSRPKVAIAAQLPPGIPGEAELVDVWLVDRLPIWRVREAISACLPPGFTLLDAYDVWPGEASLPGQVVASVYRVELELAHSDRAALRVVVDGILHAPSLPRVRRKGDRSVAYDLRPFVAAIEVIEAESGDVASVRMTLRHDPEKGIGRPEELVAEIGDRLGSNMVSRLLVRERLVLASDDARGAAAAMRPSAAPRRSPRRPT